MVLNESSVRAFAHAAIICAMLAASTVAVAQGDAAAAGERIAKSGVGSAPACATCHGAKGEGMAAAGFPYLAGQGSAYLLTQLKDFANGTRSNPVMQPIAKALTDDQAKSVAAFYAGLPRTFNVDEMAGKLDSYPPSSDAGAWIANRGDWDSDIPACIQCHGPGGVGVGDHFPALAGLPAAYLSQQMTAMRDGKRPEGPLGLMGTIAKRMTPEQISAVSAYFAGLTAAASGETNGKGAKQ